MGAAGDAGILENFETAQLAQLSDDAMRLMEHMMVQGSPPLRAPETCAVATRSAAKLARIWAWAAARLHGEPDLAARVLAGAEPGELDRPVAQDASTPLAREVDALAMRALRLQSLYGDRLHFSSE